MDALEDEQANTFKDGQYGTFLTRLPLTVYRLYGKYQSNNDMGEALRATGARLGGQYVSTEFAESCSVHQAAELKSNLYISERVKPFNEQIYYLVDNINSAINYGKQISFRYFHYDQNRREVPNNNGKRYYFSPYFLVWNEDHYYAVGYSEKHQKIGTFRVDRMKEVRILSADAVEKPTDFNLPEFTRQVFDMYDGTTETVTLLCKNDMMNYIIDRFGDAVETSPIDHEHFTAVAEVSVSQTFFAWVFQFNGNIRIIEPTSIIDEYRSMLANALD